jgi:enediyne polyketide synthase
MNSAIAIVGMACCYPDAKSPHELWENVLAQRRAFRRLPPERLQLQDYLSSKGEIEDAIYASEAALIEGYEFDRVRFRVAGPIYRSVDLAHWLALDVADQALKDAGCSAGEGLRPETTGVLVGNTLTGEFSRAATLRLRWPYVRRVVEKRLRAEGWDGARRFGFLRDLEESYKAPFPPVGEETLAGALSNTIAGRICNYFHFGGGGYTLDGACCSSLLAVARACSALVAGEIDAALAGGVDLSLDPFELVGFAKAGALARGPMRVYDMESTGFLPGEGSGFVVLMRSEDAIARGLRTYATIRGWGISSDGSGGIMRPEVRGQSLALERAYQRAGYGVETVALFEGHGTGTPVGDEVELAALSDMRRGVAGEAPAAAIGSIKANIGHTKAAAGIAGLLKAVLAVHHQILPPTTGVLHPRPEVNGNGAVLRVLADVEGWPEDQPVRAGINSFGFGGINVHVAIEGCRKPNAPDYTAQLAPSGVQDQELFLFDAKEIGDLANQVLQLAEVAPQLSYSEMVDVSHTLAHQLSGGCARAAVVASSPAELGGRLQALQGRIEAGDTRHLDPERGVFLGMKLKSPRIAFLFPGQASPVRLRAGIHGRCFTQVRELYQIASLPPEDTGSTDVAQLAIVTAELAGIRMLDALGIEATWGLGHSLGELTAYSWAQAVDEGSLLELVRARGRIMSDVAGPQGAMASISANASEVESLIEDRQRVVVACFNAPHQIVISGEKTAVARVASRAQDAGFAATLLPTSHAFHSPLMTPGIEDFREAVASLPMGSPRRPIFSTITGAPLSEGSDLRGQLVEQFTAPVRFDAAIYGIETDTDIFLEVGPGRILTNLLPDLTKVPAVPLDVAADSLAGLLRATAAAFVMGATLRLEALFGHRFRRPFDLGWHPKFFVNPCELAPPASAFEDPPEMAVQHDRIQEDTQPEPTHSTAASDAIEIVRELVAKRTELPATAVSEAEHLLRDLHLSSIVVGEIVTAAARQLRVAPPAHLLQFADATVGELAQALQELRSTSGSATPEAAVPPGINEWQRAFVLDWVPHPLPPSPALARPSGNWLSFGPPDHPLLDSLARTELPGNGVIVLMSTLPLEEQVGFLLSGAHTALHLGGSEGSFVVVGPVSTMGGFVRTLGLESPGTVTRVIEAPADLHLIELIREEVAGGQRHTEARYDSAGGRYEPCLRLLDNSLEGDIPIRRGEVVIISGGGKGVAAECAFTLGQRTGATLVLLGRSSPEDDPALGMHLNKLQASDVHAHYICTDVGNLQSVRDAVFTAEEMYGPVVGLVHGAGRNDPTLLIDLDEAALARTFEPKINGFRNLVDAVDTKRLRLLVTFGSVIGRLGLQGEAHYALANAYLSCLTEDFSRRHPQCRCLAFESSAWSEVGMAKRLGKVEALRSAGITAIPPKEGTSWFCRLVSRSLPATAVVLTGRLGASSPLPMEGSPLPILRFLEGPRVHYPGVELIVDVELTTASDPYLLDHVFQGEPLFPAVLALEAMVQVAGAVMSSQKIPILQDVWFDRPIVVEAGARVTVRIVALVTETGRVDVALRSSQTSFHVDHFRCSCLFPDSPSHSHDVVSIPEPRSLSVDPKRDLYGRVLFQGPRFQRLAGYRGLSARFAWADVASGPRQTWFNQYLSNTLTLGDPAARDAALHSIQACVPHAVLLPLGIERICAARLDPDEKLVAHAKERWSKSDTYCYDLDLLSEDGMLRESWQGLRLRKVADGKIGDWPDAMVAAFLEWKVRDLHPSTRVFAAFERDGSVARRRRTERAIQRALDAPWPVHWRAEGKPEVDAPFAVSAAHADRLTLAVAGPHAIACDLEPIRTRTEKLWRDLLGAEKWLLATLIANHMSEDLNTSATRVWTAVESLAKAGVSENASLTLQSTFLDRQGGISLRGPGLTISSFVVRFQDDPAPIAVAILTRSEECEATNTDTESVLKIPTL